MSKYRFNYITGHVKVVNKYNSTDMDGETEGGGTFRFMLRNPLVFVDVNRKSTVYTHVELEIGGWWSDTPAYVNGNKKQRISVRPIPKLLWRDMYQALLQAETGNGQLKDWCFSDDIYESAYPTRKVAS